MARTSKGKTTTRRRGSPRGQFNAEFVTGGDLDTSMFFFGDLNLWGAFPTVPTVYQRPRAQVFYMTRNWFERQVFLKQITLLKFDVYNYGFKLVAANKPSDTSDEKASAAWDAKNAKVQKWWEANKVAVTNLVRDAWSEWFIQDNAIAVWMKGIPPFIYPTEHLTYQDDFGIEALSFAHGLDPKVIASMPGLKKEVKLSLMNNKTITLQKQVLADGHHITTDKLYFFQAVKRNRVGQGLAWPQLRTLFNTVGGWESMELADWQLADALRTVYEMHKIGHEIKQGPHAGKSTHFWNKKRAGMIQKIIGNNKQTLAAIKRMIVNFDHTVEYPRPDPKHFSKERYDGYLDRMMMWSMPLGQMMFAKQVNPWHALFLKSKAATERDYIGPFIETVLKQSLDAPDGITAAWSDDIFMDPRLMLDVLKTGITNGPLSQETFLEKTGFNAQTERSRKDKENDLPSHQTRPIWDGSHGINPNDPDAGRPSGAGDKRKRNAKG